jgi:hypothetical protein
MKSTSRIRFGLFSSTLTAMVVFLWCCGARFPKRMRHVVDLASNKWAFDDFHDQKTPSVKVAKTRLFTFVQKSEIGKEAKRGVDAITSADIRWLQEHSVKCRSVLQHRRDSFTLIKD